MTSRETSGGDDDALGAYTAGVPDGVTSTGLAASDGALLLWDTDLEGFSWANAEGLAQWGALGLASLRASRLDRAMPAMERLRALTRRALPADGILQSLTFWTPRGAQTIACRCVPVDLGDGGHGLLLAWLPREPRATGHAEISSDVGCSVSVEHTGAATGVRHGVNGRQAHLPRLPVTEFQPVEPPEGTDARGAQKLSNGAALQVPGFLNGHAGGVEITRGADALPSPNEDDQFAMDEIARMLVGRGAREVPSNRSAPTASPPDARHAPDTHVSGIADGHAPDQHNARAPRDPLTGTRVFETAPQKLDNLHHELRTPLNSIIGFAEMMQREQLGAIGHPRYREYAGDILDSARHALGLINDLLDASRVRAGHVETYCEAFDLAVHLERTIALLEPQIASAQVSVVTGFPETLANVWADPRAVRQIVSNLIVNALKFTRAGGHVFVSAREAAGDEASHEAMTIIDVRDTGVGMTDAQIAEALTPWRTELGNRGGDGEIGTGLGLPLVKTLVEAQGGKLELTSAPGEGTCARVWLKRAGHLQTTDAD
ncbi:MAG: HAMP domain-containing sensor histidine kinase [Pseudomonadota bacterium]